mgnify:CR=1 FL=1
MPAPVALVAGVGRGTGGAVARRFATAGYRVALIARSEGRLKEFEAKLKEKGLGGYKELKLYTAYPETYLALANGEIDVVVQTLPNLAVVVKEHPGVFELLDAMTDKSYM